MKIDGPHFLHHIIAGAFQISRVFIGVTTHFKVRNYIEAEVHLEEMDGSCGMVQKYVGNAYGEAVVTN